MEDDATLLRRYAVEREDHAFAEVVRRHVDEVYSAALRRVGGDAHLAEDVTQQVFVALAQKAAVVAKHPVLSGWLYLATRNEAANAVRAERRRKNREKEAEAMHELERAMEPEADWTRVAPVLDGVIDELNEKDRTAVLLRFINRRSFAEIGAALQVSEDAARMRVDRALETLRARLTRRGIESSAAALGVALANHAVAAAPAMVVTKVTGAALVAGATTAATSSLLVFMSTTKVIPGAVGLAVVLAVGIATREALALHEENEAVAIATHENKVLAAKLADSEKGAAAAEQTLLADEKPVADAAAQRAKEEQARRAKVGAVRPVNGRPTPESIAAGRAFIARHPEVKQAVLDYHHANMGASFGAFYKAHAFSEDQIARFEDAMMGGAGVFRMVQDADGQLLTLSTPTWGDSEQRKRENQEMVELLGPDGVQDLRAYVRQLPARQLVTQLAAELYTTDSALTGAQVEQFTHAISEAGASLRNPMDGELNWDVITAKAQDVLTESQMAALRGIQAQRAFDRALVHAMQGGTVVSGTSVNSQLAPTK